MKIVLILMVKNESRILRRCLESVEGLADAVCIHDTGSTDDTCTFVMEYLTTHRGCLSESTFQDFGTSRTRSFEEARRYVGILGWDLADTYGLLLDADMVFQPGTLKEQTLTEIGYTIVQSTGTLQYPNCRLVRMDYPWRCVGVTHEYWDGPVKALPKSICWIDDRNDGGCKADKFERDARLLEAGLEANPTNIRYMFYLAQTYKCLGRYEESIAMYKKRIAGGGWFEEVWYSHYMIGECYLLLKDPVECEAWMLRAYAYRPVRAEPLYKLARYFREQGQHHKAYHYVSLGLKLPIPDDSLFVETDVYDYLLPCEATILLYYVHADKREGLMASTRYLLRDCPQQDLVYQNMGFYMAPIALHATNHPILRDACGLDYHPSSVSMFTYEGESYQNVRFVNYTINHKTGSYTMKQDGAYSPDYKVRTENVCFGPSEARTMRDTSVTLPRRDARIRGLEDIRVYEDASGTLCFLATTSEYTEKIRVLHGRYHVEDGTYSDCVVLDSPLDRPCEKNWIPIDQSDTIIYQWHPYQLGKRVGNTLEIQTEYMTPSFFRHLRGSAVPIRVGEHLWALTHFVHYSTPRKYFHCFVKLHASTYKPLAISLPFVFRSVGIEYCIGCRVKNNQIAFAFSNWDDMPMCTDVPISAFEWLDIHVSP